jgi:hypothetical protein
MSSSWRTNLLQKGKNVLKYVYLTEKCNILVICTSNSTMSFLARPECSWDVRYKDYRSFQEEVETSCSNVILNVRPQWTGKTPNDDNLKRKKPSIREYVTLAKVIRGTEEDDTSENNGEVYLNDFFKFLFGKEYEVGYDEVCLMIQTWVDIPFDFIIMECSSLFHGVYNPLLTHLLDSYSHGPVDKHIVGMLSDLSIALPPDLISNLEAIGARKDSERSGKITRNRQEQSELIIPAFDGIRREAIQQISSTLQAVSSFSGQLMTRIKKLEDLESRLKECQYDPTMLCINVEERNCNFFKEIFNMDDENTEIEENSE